MNLTEQKYRCSFCIGYWNNKHDLVVGVQLSLLATLPFVSVVVNESTSHATESLGSLFKIKLLYEKSIEWNEMSDMNVWISVWMFVFLNWCHFRADIIQLCCCYSSISQGKRAKRGRKWRHTRRRWREVWAEEEQRELQTKKDEAAEAEPKESWFGTKTIK